jgi:hypothetical protein
MTSWSFDPDQFRRNWERATDLPPDGVIEKFARVVAPRDTYKESREVLARVRTLAGAELERSMAVLTPFFGQAAGIIDKLAALPPDGAGKEKEALQTELAQTLADLEDLLALYSGFGR